MTKTAIRTRMKAFLAGLSAEDRHSRSLAACAQLMGTKEFRSAQMVMLFMSTPTEVETSTVAVRAWTEAKNIAMPRMDWDNNRIEPVEVKSLETGIGETRYGLREPLDGKLVPLDMIDMVVIPGLAFDRRGYRVGRGKGFYDRFLCQQDFQGVRCALCFHEQLLDRVPFEAHDVPMDLIVTEREVIHCAGMRAPARQS